MLTTILFNKRARGRGVSVIYPTVGATTLNLCLIGCVLTLNTNIRTPYINHCVRRNIDIYCITRGLNSPIPLIIPCFQRSGIHILEHYLCRYSYVLFPNPLQMDFIGNALYITVLLVRFIRTSHWNISSARETLSSAFP